MILRKFGNLIQIFFLGSHSWLLFMKSLQLYYLQVLSLNPSLITDILLKSILYHGFLVH